MRQKFKRSSVVFASVTALFFATGSAVARSPGEMLGAGNISLHRDASHAVQRFEDLNTIGIAWCRMTVSASHYAAGPDKRPRPDLFDEVVLAAHARGIQPMILFEFYTRSSGALDDYDWRAIGRAFASRFAPNSPWLRGHGIDDWGIELYTAINEPMWRANNPAPIPVGQYVQALEDLAAGVHAVDPALKVSPGGFQEIPLLRDNPYGPAIARLYNAGKLHSIDIHRYYDIQHQPMYGTYRNSLQNQFDEVKRQWGITRDIRFHTTEFNFKKREVSETEAAAGFLTAIWDALGVVGDQGQPVTLFAMPWNVFHSPERDEHYGMCAESSPWQGTPRGRTLQHVCHLTEGMEFTQLDPRQSGIFVLAGGGRKLWVWQNRKGWTDRPGTTLELVGLPEDATVVEVHGWDGLRRTLCLSPGQTRIRVEELPEEETAMLLAR